MKNKIIIAIAALFILNAAFSQTETNDQFNLSLDSFSAKINKQIRPQIIDARSAEEFTLNNIEGA